MTEKRRRNEAPKRTPPDLPADIEDLRVITADDFAGGEPIEESVITNADFTGRRIAGLQVWTSILEGVSLANCAMPSAQWRDVRFMRCDLSNAKLRGLRANRVEFVDCRLTGMEAVECVWEDVLVENCDGKYLQLRDGRAHMCEFRTSDLAEADLSGTSFDGTVFSQVRLNQADLRHSKLRNTDLRGAVIDEITVEAEDVRGAIVSPPQAMDLARLLGLIIR